MKTLDLTEYAAWSCDQKLEDIRTHSKHEFWKTDNGFYILQDRARLFILTKDYGGVYRPFEVSSYDIRLVEPIEKEEFTSEVGQSYYSLLDELICEV